MPKTKKTLFIVLAIVALVFLVTSSLSDSNSANGKKIFSRRLSEYDTLLSKKVGIVLREKPDATGKIVRTAFLVDENKGEREIGALTKSLPGAPVEAQFVEIEKYRFVILWIDKSVEGDLETITLQRPQKLANDDSMRVLRVSWVSNRVGIIPISPDEHELWGSIDAELIGTRKIGFESEVNIKPAVKIDRLFKKMTL